MMNEAQSKAKTVFREANHVVTEWIRSMGGWSELPNKFEIGGERWEQVEEEICIAANAGDAAKVAELGESYIERVRRFCQRWDQVMKTKEAA